MDPTNQSTVTYFILKGISDVPELQVPIFIFVLLIYLITISGNMTIFLLICLDHRLHTPMYFFLGNLALIDMSTSTVTLHKILTSFVLRDNTISHLGCITQFYMFSIFTVCEMFLLTTMSYDRYVAIYNPLNYNLVMNWRICTLLTTGCWVWSVIAFLPHSIILSGFKCYRLRKINHFFCDIGPLVQLTCSDTHLLDLLFFINTTFNGTCPPLLTIIPYIFIIVTIVRIKSSSGRRKAFYTCSSHLTVVVLFYVTLNCQYIRTSLKESSQSNKNLSLLNTAAVPMLNPIIYSLKNKEVKSSLKQRLSMVPN